MVPYSGIVQIGRDEICEDHGHRSISSKDQCKRAAQCLADTQKKLLKFDWLSGSEYPFGCFHVQSGHHDWFRTYFNPNSVHSRNYNCEPICIRNHHNK